jgi:hypothetical protein
MNRALRDVVVTGYEGLIGGLELPEAAALKNPPRSVGEVLDALRSSGLVRSVARLRELFGP